MSNNEGEGSSVDVMSEPAERDWCRRCFADFPTDEDIELDLRDENDGDMVIDECRSKACGALYIYRINQQPSVDLEGSQCVDQGVLPF